jgi:hypothetical protein
MSLRWAFPMTPIPITAILTVWLIIESRIVSVVEGG